MRSLRLSPLLDRPGLALGRRPELPGDPLRMAMLSGTM
jgi:hypothetical protein